MIEEWREIPGYPNYMASSEGRIKSKERRIWNRFAFITRPEKVLTGHVHQEGYIRVKVNNGHKFLHILVGEAFCEPDVDRKFFNHKDGNKKNNAASNLERCTKSENSRHAVATGLWTKPDVCANSKLDPTQVKTIKSLLIDRHKKLHIAKIARYFNVSDAVIFDIRKGKTYNKSIYQL
jgi:hypothetical protein